jgi:hypothetical protein
MIVLGAVVGGVVWLAVMVTRGRKAPGPAGPTCAACGYSVVGLATTTCPECGGDLRAVGIVAAGARRPGAGLLPGFLLYTLLLAFVAIVVTSVLVSILPMRRTYQRNVRLVGPESGAYKEVVIRTGGQGWGTGGTPPPVEIELIASGAATGRPPRIVLRPDGSYQLTASPATATRHGDFGPLAILAWLNKAGVDTTSHTSSHVQQEAARIASEARIAARAARRGLRPGTVGGFSSSRSGGDSGGQFASNFTTETGERRPPLWAPLLLVLFWLVVWVSGLTYLARRNRTPPR